MTVLVYGANGYVGRQVVEAAVRRDVPVVAAARSASVRTVAAAAGVPARVFGVDAPDLSDVRVLLNAAGPFSATAAPLARACIAAGVHYLDVAGELDEFAAVRELDASARHAGVMLMPGVGFGVVPTDALAAHLVERLPAAQRLELAMRTSGGVSGGTLRTMLGGFGHRGAVPGPELRRTTVPFPSGPHAVIQNPWRGDLLTAPVTTGVDDVTTWIALPGPLASVMARAHRDGTPDRPSLVLRGLRALARRAPAGPSPRKLAAGSSELWGRATADDGGTAEAVMELPDAYVVTVDAALAVAASVLDGAVTPGFATPAGRYGTALARSLPGVRLTDR